MSVPELDEVIHAPNRLQVCAFLAPLTEAEFQVLRKELGVSDSVLSKHLKRLEDARYVRIRKGILGGRNRTWIGLTPQGRAAFEAHIRALKRIVTHAEAAKRAGRI